MKDTHAILGYFSIILIVSLIVGGIIVAVMFVYDIPSEPKEQNVFDEIYNSFMGEHTPPGFFSLYQIFDLELVSRSKGMEMYRCNCEQYAMYETYPGLANEDQILLLFDTDQQTISFQYVVADGQTCTYQYSVRKNRLVCEGNDDRTPKEFLFELLLPNWIDRTEGYSDFSYGAWGEYQFEVAA